MFFLRKKYRSHAWYINIIGILRHIMRDIPNIITNIKLAIIWHGDLQVRDVAANKISLNGNSLIIGLDLEKATIYQP